MENIRDNLYKHKIELVETNEEKGTSPTIGSSVWETKEAFCEDNQKDEFISRDSGYEKEEYTEYHQIMRRKIHKIDGIIVGYSDLEQSRTYSIIAEVKEKEAIRRNINETDVEIIIPRILVIYNEDTNEEKEKKLSPKKEIINFISN